jgi:hypothetical protein
MYSYPISIFFLIGKTSAYCSLTRLTRSLCMWQEKAQATHFPGCTCGQRRDACSVPPPPTLPGRVPQHMHAAPVCPPAHCCRRTCLRAAATAPAVLTTPAVAVHMLLRMHVGAAAPASLPARTRGPPPSTPTSLAWSCNTCNTKHLLQRTSERNMKHLQTYACNIYVWPLQHLDKIFVIYV